MSEKDGPDNGRSGMKASPLYTKNNQGREVRDNRSLRKMDAAANAAIKARRNANDRRDLSPPSSPKTAKVKPITPRRPPTITPVGGTPATPSPSSTTLPPPPVVRAVKGPQPKIHPSVRASKKWTQKIEDEQTAAHKKKMKSATQTAKTSSKSAARQAKPKKVGKFTHGLSIEGTDSFVNKGQIYLEFYHLPTGESVAFKGYITDFQDTYNVDFKKEDVYGRLDPIAIYSGTKRDITIGWTLVAETEDEAYDNLRRTQQYIQMLYPSYNKFRYGKYSVSTLGSPPLLKMKFMNLITNSRRSRFTNLGTLSPNMAGDKTLNPTGVNRSKTISLDFKQGNARSSGLLVIPGNISINHNLQDRGALLVKNDTVGTSAIPFEITMSSTYTVLHEHDLGTRRGYKTIDTRNKAKIAKLKGAASMAAALVKDHQGAIAREKLKGIEVTPTQWARVNKRLKRSHKTVKDKLRKAQRKAPKVVRTGTGKPRGFDNFPYGAKDEI